MTNLKALVRHILEFIVREYHWAKWREEAKQKSPRLSTRALLDR